MNAPGESVAFVTKSYGPDLERCELLCRSIDRLSPTSSHWLVVDRADRDRFAHLENDKRRLVTTEDLLPLAVRRIALGRLAPRRNVWLSTAARPMRGWLVQQLAKLAIARLAREEVLFYVDSDIVFMRHFDAVRYAPSDEVPLYCVPGAIDDHLPEHVQWHRAAEALLGLPPVTLPAPDFVGPLVFWRRDHALGLLDVIERRSGTSWVAALARASHVSEYTLYGRWVVDLVGASAGGHRLTSRSLCHSYWPAVPLREDELESFLATASEDHVAVMLNPKAGMPASWYGPLLERRWQDEDAQTSRSNTAT